MRFSGFFSNLRSNDISGDVPESAIVPESLSINKSNSTKTESLMKMVRKGGRRKKKSREPTDKNMSLRGEWYLSADSDEESHHSENRYSEEKPLNPYPQSYQTESVYSSRSGDNIKVSSSFHKFTPDDNDINFNRSLLPEYASSCLFVSVLLCSWTPSTSKLLDDDKAPETLLPCLVSTATCSGFLILNMLHWHHQQSFVSQGDHSREKRVNSSLRMFLLLSQIGSVLSYIKLAFDKYTIIEIGEDDIIEATYTRTNWMGLLFLLPAVFWLFYGVWGWKLTSDEYMSMDSIP